MSNIANISEESMPCLIGGRMKSRRNCLGLTRYDLSKILGLKEETIANAESGLIRFPDEVMSDIAKALGTTLDYLLWHTDDPTLKHASDTPKEEEGAQYFRLNITTPPFEKKVMAISPSYDENAEKIEAARLRGIVAKRVKERRKAIGYTQRQLAEAAGFTSKVSITRIESGVAFIAYHKLCLLARLLYTTPNYLLGYDEETEIVMEIRKKRKKVSSDNEE